MFTENKVTDFKINDKVRYTYHGFGVSYIGSLNGEVIKINKKTVKVKLYRPVAKEYLMLNINPIELTKIKSL